MWTAEEAVKKAQYYQYQIMYNLICNEIKTAVCTGKRECIFPNEVPDSIREDFEMLGYKVIEEWDFYNGTNFSCRTYIKW